MQPTPVATTDNILVLGAGELGLAMLHALAGLPGVQVTVMLRPAAPGAASADRRGLLAELDGLGVGVVTADVVNDSEQSLATLFSGFDRLISCLGFVSGPGMQLKLTRAALRSDVKHYVPWQFGVDYDQIGYGSPQNLFDEQLDVRQLLRAQSRLQWQIIATGMFTSFLFEPAFGVVDLQHNRVRALGSWETAVTVTTPQDIARLTARILFDPERLNRVTFTAGDTITYRQLADVIDQSLGRQVERLVWTLPVLSAELAAQPDDSMRRYRAVFAQGKGVAWPKAQTYNAQRQIETTGLQGWVDAHLRCV
ncbi:aromatic alcohol reductase [Pseudomonas sp. D1-3]|uniref:aromatic alcohol reductase n=1 Tax=Phytopseudomonas argentinensis TaxID=289370 RepID=UPI0008A83B17|nr:aromatic alcohol reductase [Pseudomonas argentinensis]